jgi:hypothetical protein
MHDDIAPPGAPAAPHMAPITPANTASEQLVPDAAANCSSPGLDPIKTKNRRKRYLDLHPEYFGSDLELAGVLLMAVPFN